MYENNDFHNDNDYHNNHRINGRSSLSEIAQLLPTYKVGFFLRNDDRL